MKFITKCSGVINADNMAHLEAHPEVIRLLPEACSKIELPACPEEGQVAEICVHMGRAVGRSGCVYVGRFDTSDVVSFALRKGRSFPSVVTMKEGEGSMTVMVICGFHDGSWKLYTAWVGPPAHREIHDRKYLRGGWRSREAKDSIRFWTENALTWNERDFGPIFQSTWDHVMAEAVK